MLNTLKTLFSARKAYVAASHEKPEITILLNDPDADLKEVVQFGKYLDSLLQDGKVAPAATHMSLELQQQNAFLSAVSECDLKAVKSFLDNGMNPNIHDNELGWTPLIWAVVQPEQNSEIIDALIAHGADVNLSDNEGTTPLMCAGTADIAKKLMNAGADVNQQEKNGRNALMIMAFERLPEGPKIIKSLIDAGADLNQQDTSGYTALHWAVEYDEHFDYEDKEAVGNVREMIKLLIEAGADPSIKSNKGKTALDLARDEKFGFPAVIDILETATKTTRNTSVANG